ncbi:MAG: tryptophan halogenase family protein [Thiolinea sp.]
MEQKTIHLVIVGGGTAGWLTALILQAEARRQSLPLDITLVESSKIPTIGVGEGTTSIFGGVLQGLGIDESEFLANTDATIKYGIRHRDWRRLGHYYDGPIDDAYALAEQIPRAGSWLDTFCVAAGRSVTEPHVFAALMAAGKAPVAEMQGRQVPVSRFQHAYHFDQAKVGAYLRSKAQHIKTIDALVESAQRDPQTGHIRALQLDSGVMLNGDFFIDCSGFRRTLIHEVMEVPWVVYGDSLPVNRAMPFWLELQEDEELPAYTHAWAQTAGWLWQIPTQGRIGCGYVYSDRHLSPEQAQAEIEAVLGHAIEPRNDIRINAGRLAEVWCGNVLALGLASSFLEPLEATSIHGTVVALLLFAQRHLNHLNQPDPKAQARFNAAIARQVDDFRDFINLHYVSERDDSPFWRDVAGQYIQPQTREKLAMWQNKMPGVEDFQNDLGGLPHVEELLHYPVLDGLGLLSRDVAKAAMARDPKFRAFARETADYLTRQGHELAARALSHRAWLDSLRIT